MYVAAIHDIQDPAAAFPRGDRLIRGEGAPQGTRALQFYPAQDQSTVTCLWETESVSDVQSYVDEVLGDASVNTCYAVADQMAFSERPLGIAATPPVATS